LCRGDTGGSVSYSFYAHWHCINSYNRDYLHETELKCAVNYY